MPLIAQGDLLVVRPEEMVAGGDALARLDGLPIFIPGLYPGDVARVEISEVKKGFARAGVTELIEPSPLRRLDPCSIADSCGGCDWTSLRLDAQLAAKKRILSDSLRRVGKLDHPPSIVIHPSPLNYRLRSRLHVDEASGSIGFYAAGSTTVVPLAADCEVVGPELRSHIADLQSKVERGRSIVVMEQQSRLAVAEAGTDSPFHLDVPPYRYELSTSSFFQVNRHLLMTLANLVRRIAAGSGLKGTAFDLYGGVGFFALPLAEMFDRVCTVESSAESSRLAGLNTRQARGNIEVVCDDVLYFMRRRKMQPDFVLVDPPRAGLHPDVTEAIADSTASLICYLSCDPVTFSRDASRLVRRGWRLVSLDLLDLFPNTHHVETLSSFKRDA